MLDQLPEKVVKALAALACFLVTLGLIGTPPSEPASAARALPPPPSAAVRDAALSVAVTGERDAAVADAAIEVFWERDGKQYRAASGTSDESGRARFSELPRGRVWVLAHKPGLSRASLLVTLGEIEIEARLELVAEATLAVTVVDEQGEPIARATVLVTASDPLPFGALTSSEGRARVPRLPPGPYRVKASALGYESVERAGVSGPVTLALRRLGSIKVRVEHADGSAAPSATVSIAGSSLWPARRTEVGQDGTTRISGLLAGSYDLQATLGSEISEPTFGLLLERGQDLELTLRLEPGRSVTALVTDGEREDAPVVSGADVVLTPSGLASFPLRGRTGADGKVTLGPIATGPATLAARAEGFVSSPLVAVPEDVNEPVRVPLVRGATLRGEVVDARGFPVDGAGIEVVGTDSYGLPIAETPLLAAFRSTHFDWSLSGPPPLIPAGELGVTPGPVPPIPPPGARIEPGIDPSSLFDRSPSFEPWVTRSDGSFVARPVTPGRVRAIARHPDYVEGVSDAVVLGPGGEARVKIVLLAGGTLEGRVLDDRGLPVGGAEIEVASSQSSLVRYALARADGTFSIPALPAEVVVSLRRSGGDRRVALRETLSIPEGERREVELTLPAPREPLRVEVLNGDDEPVELAQVTVLSLDANAPLRETVFTGADGSAELEEARGLPLRIVVEAPGFPRVTRVVDEAPATLRVALAGGVLVEGRVTAVRGRRGVDGVFVTLLFAGERRSARTDEDGRYRVSNVAEGRARLTLSHPDYAELTRDVDIRATGRADRPFELEPVDLEEPGSVTGEVVDSAGEPVAGARVSVGLAPAYLPAGALPRGVAVTDGSGRFELRTVAPGVRTVEAFSSISGRGRASVEVRAGRSADGLRIELHPSDGEDPVGDGSVAVTLGERGEEGAREVVVVAVPEASEAERAGLTEGDLIVAVDEQAVTSMAEARRRLAGRLGSDVVIEVRRAGERVVLRVAREAVRR